MIEKMLKSTVFFSKNNNFITLKKLQELNVLHIKENEILHAEELINKINFKIDKINLLLNILPNFNSNILKYNYNKYYVGTVVDIANNKYKELVQLNDNLSLLQNKYNKIKYWGNFSFNIIDDLKSECIYTYFCIGNKSNINNYNKLKDIYVELISKKSGLYYFVVITKLVLSIDKFSDIIFFDNKLSLEQINSDIFKIKKLMDSCKNILSSIFHDIDKIKIYRLNLIKRLEFYVALGRTKNEFQELNYITGFIPEKKRELLVNTAKKNNWGILFENPSNDDNPPLILNQPKYLKFSQCLFKFIDMYPGYFEWDISVCFLLFFTIFCGIILGDAGYGLFFIVLCFYLRIKYKDNIQKKDQISLFLMLGFATTIWGLLTCSLFGIPQKFLPYWMLNMKNIILGNNVEIINRSVESICFLLGALHLSIAKIWRAYSFMNISSIGEIGWALVIWANSFTLLRFIAQSDYFLLRYNIILYIIGTLMILIFYVNWKKVDSILDIIFSFIGSFSDVLSYIRLFAVWFAGIHIIECFTNMANIVGGTSYVYMIFSILIMIFAHLLNIGLAFIAVLVHAMRLNMLEFSNQMGLKWPGTVYKPFNKNL